MTCIANNTKTLKVGSSCIQFQNILPECINIVFNIYRNRAHVVE